MKSIRMLIVLTFVAVVFTGCSTVSMPQYLKAENPYRRQFLASYEDTLEAAIQALNKHGWAVARQESPLIFEQEEEDTNKVKRQAILFTKIRQTAFFFASRYSSLNIIVQEGNPYTDLEIIYFSVLSTMFRNTETDRNDHSVNRILDDIAIQLSKKIEN